MNSDSQKYKIYKLVEKKWYKSAFRWLVSAMLIAAIVTNSQPALAFSTNNHKRITRNAFPFMIDDILDIIVEGNLDEDLDDEANMAERHAVNCQFRASAKYYNMRYEQVVDALREKTIPTGLPVCSATSCTACKTSIHTRTGSPRRLRGWGFDTASLIRAWGTGQCQSPIQSCSTTL
jgi:hypothetical protein